MMSLLDVREASELGNVFSKGIPENYMYMYMYVYMYTHGDTLSIGHWTKFKSIKSRSLDILIRAPHVIVSLVSIILQVIMHFPCLP